MGLEEKIKEVFGRPEVLPGYLKESFWPPLNLFINQESL